MASETDADQKVVKAYVPAYQKEEWREHANELEMSQSEFIKIMVQAGRRDFTFSSDEAGQMDTVDEAPGVEGLESRVLNVLDDGYCSWDELVESLIENIEERLETTLQRLQSENQVRYSGRHGGYTIENSDGD
ncbi:DUF5805 domain-containing protein [Halococcus agarilyticus]|uniref:DUF5805 domain-containing protein n=1 Tax=Halococcus agarilyticus TaxID=1232219 RepID=UPI000677BCE4|nr:DUF5805 domain-containing protein [Halococcus agarilyticus]